MITTSKFGNNLFVNMPIVILRAGHQYVGIHIERINQDILFEAMGTQDLDVSLFAVFFLQCV